MITKVERYVVSHDDLLADEFAKKLTKEDGWKIRGTTLCTIYEQSNSFSMVEIFERINRTTKEENE